jgi:hypothetical protein
MSDRPQKVHEPVWAFERLNPHTREHRWSEAVITSRGGADPNRVTVSWKGRSFRCRDYGRRNQIDPTGTRHLTTSLLLHFWRDRAAGEEFYRNMFDQLRVPGAPPPAINAWELVGLQPGASPAAIRKAFNAKAKKVHPDQGGDADIFRVLVKARDMLLAGTNSC